MQAKMYSASQHNINVNEFGVHAIQIAQKIIENGFEAYFVGGCLRDLLLDKKPKDIDIATNARPEEVAALFRNSRLIGRRFRLVHIHYGRNIIEVATFRAGSTNNEEFKTTDSGLVTEDNHYGTIEDDVVRRDFTVNSLFYEPNKQILIDYLGSIDDLKNKKIRFIGDAQTRCIEDPVRMLRAARFAAKLDMQPDEEAQKAIENTKHNLHLVSSSRLFDEVQKLFLSGYAVKAFEQLEKYGLFAELFPDVGRVLAHEDERFANYARAIIVNALHQTDQRIAQNRPVTIAFIFSAFFWTVFQLQYAGLVQERDNWHSAMHEAVDLVLIAASERVSIPVRLRGMIREIWILQANFDTAIGKMKKSMSLLAHSRFRAGFDFLSLRYEAGEDLSESIAWWKQIQEDPERAVLTPKIVHRKDVFNKRRKNHKGHRNRRRR